MRHYERHQAYPMPGRRMDLLVLVIGILVILTLVVLEVPAWL